ncbi:oligoendopeptidase F [Alkalihalobacillus xiaoxiensis]|uniref:Oligoendopeptidase F n=1 Tax=Shouchella xiaoxiensis TaxID=766895 RepID=A0ABS2SX40_9BACI|nr:M3 family oligoendopeptidase [Shouchella xiaoxiensis]MBM7840109.1 oligoendopeptidase F [Shouchella xiaoxiensis]
MSKFYQSALDFNDTENVVNRFEEILAIPLDSVVQLEVFLQKESELLGQIEEMLTGHYIDFNCYSNSTETKKVFEHDQEVIEPIVKTYSAKLDSAFLGSKALKNLPEERYGYLVKRRKNAEALFREENITLEIEENRLTTAYFEHTGSLTVNWDGEEKTLAQLSPYSENSDREIRKKAMSLSREAFLVKEKPLQEIMSELIEIRQKKATNAGFVNYRDYMFKKYERFDYSPSDCKELAQNIATYVKPLKEKLHKEHQDALGVETYKPWDVSAVLPEQAPLKPFSSTQELIVKSRSVLTSIDDRFGELLHLMDDKKMLDLESRKSKSPGGFCAPLPVSGLSFVFMNHAHTHDDLITLLHEMGHCIHNDLKKDIPLHLYRDTPMESSELASMSMELFTMNQWEQFYSNNEELKRAKRMQLKSIVDFLPAGMVIDQFQHWLYENTMHTVEERNQTFKQLLKAIDSEVADWSEHEEWQETAWLRILHIFEVPFYYVEYVIAQLGALQMYKAYKENPVETLESYKRALTLGSSKGLADVYKTAGIRFDFSAETIRSLMDFIETELKELDQ